MSVTERRERTISGKAVRRLVAGLSVVSLLGATACWNTTLPPEFANVKVGGNEHGSTMAGGSVPAVNTLSVPICQVVVTSASEPDKSFVNEDKGKVFLSPGEQKDVFSPALNEMLHPTSADALDKVDKHMNVAAYGCKKDAYDWAVDDAATLFQKSVTFDKGQKLVLH